MLVLGHRVICLEEHQQDDYKIIWSIFFIWNFQCKFLFISTIIINLSSFEMKVGSLICLYLHLSPKGHLPFLSVPWNCSLQTGSTLLDQFSIVSFYPLRREYSIVSDKRLRLRASLVIDDVCLYEFAGTSLNICLILWPPRFSFSVPIDAFMLDPLLAELNKSQLIGCWFVSAVATADAIKLCRCGKQSWLYNIACYHP